MAERSERLKRYAEKRDFSRTDEPEGSVADARRSGLAFVVQKHAARRLHYDFRLEWDGVLLSWAVTRGPSEDPGEKRLAVRTEDHPLDYGGFEGVIPKGQYGGGTVMLWDRGAWEPEGDVAAGLDAGKIAFTLNGVRMRGKWALVRMRGRKGETRENWLLIKERDEAAVEDAERLTSEHLTSVASGRGMEEIAAGRPAATRSREGRRPKFRAPQLATLVSEAPEGDGWIHETKFDGYRCLVALGKGGARFHTRSGKDWTDRFGALTGAFDGVPCDTALIDGEVMARDVRGSAFSALQAALTDGAPLVFHAFDLLSLDGEDLSTLPQLERREWLEALLAGLPEDGALRMSAHVRGGGHEVYRRACAAGGEGIVSKRVDAPYRSGRTKAWLKVKCTRRREFVIGGWSPSRSRGRPFASLLVGENGPTGLRYRGRVGTGFGARDFAALVAAMTERKTCPFGDVPADVARDARWVRPDLVVEVEFAELTGDELIRHGSYQGLRRDKEAKDVTLETPKETGGGAVEVAGVRISNPDREVFPEAGRTKADLARYVERAGDRLTEIAGRRPLSLVRCPEGIGGQCFFQKHGGIGFPSALSRIEIEESDGGTGAYLYATRTESFVAAVQMGVIEFHIQGARVDRLDRPDRLVFDLDPDEKLGWSDVLSAARDCRDRLGDLGLASTPLVTGGKGVHVCVPLRRTRSWESVKLFAKTFAHVMAEAEPDRFTATMSKARRTGRVFIDWLRNDRSATAIAPWSARARAGAPVAVPVTWDDLDRLEAASAFRLGSVEERLEMPCPYLAALGDLQTLSDVVIDRLADRAGL